ncbi:MAG: serine hydrolase [Acidobacteria bacterium]|nr:serine hydrolase [Acidobacteriota bacterium]
MLLRRFLHLSLAAALLASNLARAAAPPATTQPPAAPASAPPPDRAARVAAVEKVFEEKRKELGIPGASLAVVKDDRVVLLKASGLRDAAKNLPATPDTLFAIGSCTKAMTALAAVMSQDDGRLSLEDSPKKFLPYFRLRDPEADAGATLRDLLSHRTGLAGTELAWYTGKLTREEAIRVAGQARPTAKLREKFQYQNVMYSAAGEAVGRAQGRTWEAVVAERILRPLGMKTTTFTVREMQASPDYSLGYELDAQTKAARHVPTRDLTNIAPAGAVNSSAREMAEWVRLMAAGGAHGGRRLVSEKGFAELLTPQIKADANASYALGWAVTKVGAHRAALHSGGIDGFNSFVGLFPDARAGFVLLTNGGGSPLSGFVMRAVVENLIDQSKPAAATAAAPQAPRPQDEAGRYDFAAAQMVIEIEHKDGKLYANVPGQPRYTLEPVEGRRYRLAELEGFYATFRPVKGKETETELYLEQPHGNYALPRIKPEAAASPGATAATTAYEGPLKELFGTYESAPGGKIEVTAKGGKVVLVVPGQPDYPLAEKEKDVLLSPLLPDSYSIHVRRDAAGKVSGLLMKQPEGEFEFKRTADAPAAAATPAPAPTPPPITPEELLTKMIAAAGGEANWRAHRSSTTRAAMELVNQGIAGEAVIYSQAPHSFARELTLTALGKILGTTREYFDGAAGGEEHSFTAAPVAWAAKKLEEMRTGADFHALVNWKTLYKSAAVREVSQAGGEAAYVLVLTPHAGAPVTEYVSTKTFLTLRRDANELPASGEGGVPVSISFADYREVGGVRVPFLHTYSVPATGEVVVRVREVKFDAPIPAETFRAKTK